MGCSISRLDNEEAVQMCKDRKAFIKQAVEQRSKFAMGHIAYIDSMTRVSAALYAYVEGDDDSPSLFTPTKKIKFEEFNKAKNPSLKINYMMSGGNSAITVQEQLQSSQIANLEMCHYGFDGIFTLQTPPPATAASMGSSSFLPPPSPPRNKQWDFFWNPFSSLDYYGYLNETSLELDQTVPDDNDVSGLKQVTEEEEIKQKDSDAEEKPTSEVTVEESKEKPTEEETTAAIEIPKEEEKEDNIDSNEKPRFTVYVDPMPTKGMNEIIKELENQFIIVCTEASKVSTANHQSILDRLYVWEKKLYEEVKAGERVRLAFEKKRAYLKSQEDDDGPLAVKTRSAMRDLHTQMKVSFHSIEAISKRIQVLRDEELQPLLNDLVQGLCRMWKTMEECHKTQKQIIDEAKHLIASGWTTTIPSKLPIMAATASNLEAELRNWQAAFKSWITSQRSFVHSLAGWLLRCIRTDETSKSRLSNALSPPQPSIDEAPPIFGLCIEWSRFLNNVREITVLDGMDFFAAGFGSFYVEHLKEELVVPRRQLISNGGGKTEMVIENNHENNNNGMSAEKIREMGVRVICGGMSVAMSSLTEFAVGCAEGYCDLERRRVGEKDFAVKSVSM
ncbi:nitrate regulatory gene2 protein-like [Impatiens glandulifera]|uniref:nitrate regulatory gene2 protein-like n=1 Tax=Impatiens glandulifera TaxID=253017 RepID=UPI001FB11EDF|nr:nitrate regulatory gene2 protein-like [Impatiens glandulifera]